MKVDGEYLGRTMEISGSEKGERVMGVNMIKMHYTHHKNIMMKTIIIFNKY